MERRRSSSRRRPKDDERRGPKSSFAHDRRDDRDRPREHRAAESAREIGKTTRKEDLQERRKKEEVAEVIEKKEEPENEKAKNKKKHDLADLQPSAKGGREKAKAGRKVSETRKKRDSSADQKERHSSASAPSRAPDRHWRDDRRRSGDRRSGDRRRDRSERRGEELPEAADRSRTPKGRPKVILEPAKRSDDRPRRVEVNVREPPKFSATDLVEVDKKRDVDSVEAAFEVPAEESKVKFAFSGKAKSVAYGGAGGLEGVGEPAKKRAKMSFQTVTSSFAELAQQATRQLEETKIAAEAAGATTAIGASCLQRTASTNLSLTRTASEQPATSPDLLNNAGNRASRFAAPTSALPKQVGAANMPTATSAMSNMMQMMGMGTSNVPGMNPMGASLWANWMQPHMGMMGQQQLIPGWMGLDPAQQAAPANRRWCKVNAPQSCWAPPKPDPPRPREELLCIYQQKIALAIDWHPNNFKDQRQEATFNFMVPDQRAAEHYANNLYNPHARAPKGDHAFRNIGENMATFIEALDGVLFGDATGNVTEHGQSGTQGHGKQWDICRAQLNMNGVRLNDEAFTLFCDWLLKRRIQVSVWKLYTNVLTSVAPLVNYVKAWREFTDDSEPMRFHEFHLQKNYLSSETILELAELCLELNKTPPVRDDLRMKLPGTYKYNEMRINVENRPPRDQDHLCPIWLRIGHNDGVRADPQGLVAAIDKLHLKYSGTGAPEAVCYVCHQYCTHLSCKRMQYGVCPVVHIQGLTDEHIEGDMEHPNDPTKLPNKHFGVPQKGMPGYGRLQQQLREQQVAGQQQLREQQLPLLQHQVQQLMLEQRQFLSPLEP
eukprot:g18086.t1